MKRVLLLVLAVVLAVGSAAGAESPTGQEILDDLSFRTILSGSGSAELTMITENAKGLSAASPLRSMCRWMRKEMRSSWNT